MREPRSAVAELRAHCEEDYCKRYEPEVDVLENEEGPSMGGAMLAAVGCGAYPDVETIGKKFAKVVDTVEPDPELVAKYEERYQKFRTLYPAMKPLF